MTPAWETHQARSGLSPLDLSSASITTVYLSFYILPVASWHHALVSSSLRWGTFFPLFSSSSTLQMRRGSLGLFPSHSLFWSIACVRGFIYTHDDSRLLSSALTPANLTVPLWCLRVPNMPKIVISSPKKPFPLPLLTPPSAP